MELYTNTVSFIFLEKEFALYILYKRIELQADYPFKGPEIFEYCLDVKNYDYIMS